LVSTISDRFVYRPVVPVASGIAMPEIFKAAGIIETAQIIVS
jgi:hypothetical protein